MLKRVMNCGAVGVNRDLSQHDLPIEAWTDARNVRFMNGSAWSFYGHTRVYGTPSVVPYHLLPVTIKNKRYWVYCGLKSVYAVSSANGASTHTNLTPQNAGIDRDLFGAQNTWTSTVLGGVPVLNSGGADVPMSWDLELTHRFVNLPNWPNFTYCASMRSYRNFLVALNVTKVGNGGEFPYMVKWSHPAAPGTLPISWDENDPTKDAGEVNLGDGYDVIVDGMPLRDSFMIYREQSVWRMDYVGGEDKMRFSRVSGTSGAMNRNCIVETDNQHFVLSGSDVVVHDGQQAVSVLSRQARQYLFQNIDADGTPYCFVFKSPYTNEIFVCYPTAGSITETNTACNRAMVWNYVDRTISFKDIPNLTHAAFGPVSPGLLQTWDSDPDSWDSDLSVWGGPDFAPDRSRVLMAPTSANLYMMDGSASQDGAQVDFYLERRGLSLDNPEAVKYVRAIRPRVTGNTGQTVNIRVGTQADPWAEPDWSEPFPFTIGVDVEASFDVAGRYIAVRFESGTAFQVKLDSYDIEFDYMGAW